MEKLYYFFYRILHNPKQSKLSFYNAYLGFLFLQYLNLGSVFILINYFTKYTAPKKTAFFLSLFVFGIILIFNYYKLFDKKELIVLTYEKLTDREKQFWILLTWGFIIFSFCFFYYVLENFGPNGIVQKQNNPFL